MNAVQASAIAGSVLAGVTGGMLFVFSNAVMGALGRGPAPVAIRTMQAINARVINPLFIGALFAPMLFGPLAAVMGGSGYALAGGVLYLVGVIGVTMVGNVPLNDRLDRMEPNAPDAPALWRAYATPWLRLNHLRSAVAMVVAALFAAGAG